MTIAEKIVEYSKALAAAGITEIQPNKGWLHNEQFPDFDTDMRSVGWIPGQEWCAYAAMLCWKKGYEDHPEIWQYLKHILSPNSQLIAKQAHADKIWPTGLTPKPGGIVIWQSGDSNIYGHTGLCLSVDGNHFTSGEGNTSSPDKPSVRSGWTYAVHTHTLGLPHSHTGLNFMRCVYVLEPDEFEKLIKKI